MDLIDCCERDFGTKSLYGVLGEEKTATREKLKKAYQKASLFLLPAQAPAHRLEEFCRKFEILSKVHYVLSNAKMQQVYDETGIIDASFDNVSANYWTSYWRKLFPHIVPEDIEDFKEGYKNSDEEREDIRIAYLRAKGNMDRFAEIYFAYTAEDEDRINYIMQKELINRKKMRSYKKFTNEKVAHIEARKNKYKRPDPEDDPASINSIGFVIRRKRPNLEEKKAKEQKEKAPSHKAPRRKRKRH